MSNTLDIRIAKNIENIEKAFIQLIRETSFQDITVQRIAKLARINRSTFYLHFDDKFNLLKCMIEKVMEPFTTNLNNFFSSRPELQKNAIQQAYKQISADQEIISALLTVNVHKYSAYKMMETVLFDSFMQFLSKRESSLKQMQKELISKQFSSSAMATMEWWLQTGKENYGVEELSDLILSILDNGILAASDLKIWPTTYSQPQK